MDVRCLSTGNLRSCSPITGHDRMSDVWSFGIVLYELWSEGGRPYGAMKNREMVKEVTRGYRLPPSADCPRVLYEYVFGHCSFGTEHLVNAHIPSSPPTVTQNRAGLLAPRSFLASFRGLAGEAI